MTERTGCETRSETSDLGNLQCVRIDAADTETDVSFISLTLRGTHLRLAAGRALTG